MIPSLLRRTRAGWLVLLLLAGCQRTTQPAPVSPTPVLTSRSAFDGDRAYGFLQAQCALGPRPPRTTAHDKCRAYLVQQLTPYVDKVITQNFAFDDTSRHVTLTLTNILGIINPQASRKVMLFTHWDTRPTADQELDAASKRKPIIGADDGASGTAVLLELARVFHQKKPSVGVELLFVDGEDWGPKDDKMYLGARHFAHAPGAYKPDYAILLDMIGAKDLAVHREINSQNLHPELNDKVWAAAGTLGYRTQFPDDTKWTITDDHLSFNDAGIPAIDLIDFDYADWHTLDDTADKCGPQSLKAVGDVIAKVIYDEK